VGGSLLLLAGVVFLTLRLRRHLLARQAERARVRRSAGEKAAFLASGVPTLERLRASGADEPLASTTEALEQRIAAGSKRGSARALVDPLERYRKSSKAASNQHDTLRALNE
jgi:hypothetical protein